MELRGHNAKHYCNYCNICRYFNGKHIYCLLCLPKNLSTGHAKRNYLAYKLLLQSYNEDYKSAVYLQDIQICNLAEVQGSKNILYSGIYHH